jgi:hypothetical protein
MPRFVPRSSRRLRQKSLRSTAAARTAPAEQSSFITCPVGVVSPGCSTLISRSRSESIPICSAIRSMCTSAANCDCGAPNPRNAPLGGVFVITTRPRIRTWSHRYGPAACSSARERTTGLSVV